MTASPARYSRNLCALSLIFALIRVTHIGGTRKFDYYLAIEDLPEMPVCAQYFGGAAPEQ